MTDTSPIAVAIAQLQTERKNLQAQRENIDARLAKVDVAIETMRDLFHLPTKERAPATQMAAAVGQAAASPLTKPVPGTTVTGSRVAAKHQAVKDRICAALQAGPMSPGDLLSKIGKADGDRKTLRRHVQDLEAAGVIIATGTTQGRRLALATAPKEAVHR